MNTYLKRYTVRANSQFNISKNIRVGENLVLTWRIRCSDQSIP